MINNIKEKMTSDNVVIRIITTYIWFLIVFLTVTILSYYILPQGLLLNKHPLQNWDTSPSLLISTLQIFAFNLMSIIVLIIGNTFLIRKNIKQCFMPLGYTAFFVMITINAIVLGTWSFSVITDAIPLMDRIIGIFDIFHRAALWEMSGQLLILCATTGISLIIMDGKETIKKKWATISLSKQEIIIIGLGLVLMIMGAFIESYSIISLS